MDWVHIREISSVNFGGEITTGMEFWGLANLKRLVRPRGASGSWRRVGPTEIIGIHVSTWPNAFLFLTLDFVQDSLEQFTNPSTHYRNLLDTFEKLY